MGKSAPTQIIDDFPLGVPGHVGYSFNGRKILGFGPVRGTSLDDLFSEDPIRRVVRAALRNDSDEFARALTEGFAVSNKALTVSTFQFYHARLLSAAYEAMGTRLSSLTGIHYAFPPRGGGSSGRLIFNCSQFPGHLGLPIPESWQGGLLRYCVPRSWNGV